MVQGLNLSAQLKCIFVAIAFSVYLHLSLHVFLLCAFSLASYPRLRQWRFYEEIRPRTYAGLGKIKRCTRGTYYGALQDHELIAIDRISNARPCLGGVKSCRNETKDYHFFNNFYNRECDFYSDISHQLYPTVYSDTTWMKRTGYPRP